MATAIIVTIKKPLGVIWLPSGALFSRPCWAIVYLYFYLYLYLFDWATRHFRWEGAGKRNENINLPPQNQ